jgi:hypothetical protein
MPGYVGCSSKLKRSPQFDLIPQAEKDKTNADTDGAVKSKKKKNAAATSPRQSPRLAAAGGGAIVPAVDIGNKRKADSSSEVPVATGGGSKSGSRAGSCFIGLIFLNWN